MKSNGKTYWILLAAITGLPLIATTAHAQQRVGNDGHALDANNRVGSGGINVVNVPPMPNINNNIVTDNTTGLFGFHGRSRNGGSDVGYTDPNGLRINDLPGAGIDAFNAVSSGVPGAGAAANYNTGPQTFYGASSTATPPPGFVSNNLNTGFVAAQPIAPGVEDLRLGTQPLNSSVSTLPMPGELMMAGPVDANAQRSMIEASPLYNVREWQTNAQGDLFSNEGPSGPDEKAIANQNRILEIRRQLNQTLLPGNPTGSDNNGTTGNPLNPAQPLNPTIAVPGAQPLTPLGSDGGGIAPSNLTQTPGNVSTGQGTRQYLDLPAPALQSAQYLELRNRLMQYDANTQMTDEQANRIYKQTLNDIRQLQLTGVAAKPGAEPTPANNSKTNSAVSNPVRINTLAKDMKSSALADLLTQAEDQIRHQQFDKAIESYNEAATAAPNNPLIVIGRANAELAGSYYKQAEADIRSAIKQDKALLMAQFNLNDLYGARFEYVVAQLKQIASDSPKDSTPLFLLAYLSYNANNPAKAQAYLDAANQRSGGNDQIISLMKNYWTLNGKSATTQPAK